ncbi:ribonuclease HI family protein [Caballeronia telluris]|uniref:Bifunctional RNase H/acid phosphatase n=1 Tax=Caballeronia telluris TaxID=326475 RepID=A0A158K342_9BURK|nr:ribonuclease HI family protein [Caballeronia telluris]SAL75517.1 bifunctional RNase H/acid phosphatase [Caballeronia telluris]
MFDFEELLSIAYKKERAQSRRLSKGASISAREALVKTLEKAAGGQSLGDLVHARRLAHARAHEAAQAREASRAKPRLRAHHRGSPHEHGAWLAWFDGSAMPNPGRIAIGAVLRSPHGETLEISAAAGHGDSSKAEYLALISVLEAALDRRAEKLVIYGDSRVVIDDVKGVAGAAVLAAHAALARRLIGELGEVHLHWIPRVRNSIADALSRRPFLPGAP